MENFACLIPPLYEKPILKWPHPNIDRYKLISKHKSGFRSKHTTVEEKDRGCKTNKRGLRKAKSLINIIDTSQVVDKVWDKGLCYNLLKVFPRQYYKITKIYLSYRTHKNYKQSDPFNILQGCALGRTVYLIFTADLPFARHTTIFTFSDVSVPYTWLLLRLLAFQLR